MNFEITLNRKSINILSLKTRRKENDRKQSKVIFVYEEWKIWLNGKNIGLFKTNIANKTHQSKYFAIFKFGADSAFLKPHKKRCQSLSLPSPCKRNFYIYCFELLWNWFDEIKHLKHIKHQFYDLCSLIYIVLLVLLRKHKFKFYIWLCLVWQLIWVGIALIVRFEIIFTKFGSMFSIIFEWIKKGWCFPKRIGGLWKYWIKRVIK